MRQLNTTLSVATRGRGIYDITSEIIAWVRTAQMTSGLLTVYIQHTSASLLINENYDRDVLTDMETFFAQLVPDGDPMFIHTVEGPDDMPAHVRTALTQVHLSIPLLAGKLALGTWQGILLYEHRHESAQRRVVLHLMGE
jgi:secondary thiamine-phosphate synthase enzyme